MYKYNDNTLFHSPGVKFNVIENIMKNGIASEKYGKEHGISVNRNYYGSNLNDTISCVRYLYVNDEVEDSAYSRYIKKGISFIMEDVPFIHDKNERIIHRSDEVLVKGFIPKEKITGISIPTDLEDTPLEELEYIRVGNINSLDNNIVQFPTSVKLINDNLNSISKYIKNKSGLDRNYDDFCRELYYTNKIFEKDRKEKKDKKEGLSNAEIRELYESMYDLLVDLNYEIGVDYTDCFRKVLGKEDVTVLDVVNHINNSTLKLPIYEIDTKKERKGSR